MTNKPGRNFSDGRPLSHRHRRPHADLRAARSGDPLRHRHGAVARRRTASDRAAVGRRIEDQRQHGGEGLRGARARGDFRDAAGRRDLRARSPGRDVEAREQTEPRTGVARVRGSDSGRGPQPRILARRGDRTPCEQAQKRRMKMPTMSIIREKRKETPAPNAPRLNVISALMLIGPLGLGILTSALTDNPLGAILGGLLGVIAALSPRVAKQWEKAVVLRLGRYTGLRGPGLFWVLPLIDSVSTYIDQRIITTNFAAEETLTADTVPVNVDAVLFWMVYDPERAALEVQDYGQAVSWAAQTALRDIIGRTALTDLLRGREKIEDELQRLIDERTTPWGVTVQSVEMRDVVIPDALQDAMSREAQASREKQARIILGQAEVEIAALFDKAADSYRENPTALHLRAMNMLYEGLKEKGALMLVPSTAVESMGMGGLLGAAAMRQQQLAKGDEEEKLAPVK